MITEEIKTMCETLSTMVPDQLNAHDDAFILVVNGKGGEQTIMCSYGEMVNLGMTFITGILRYIEAIPKELQGPVVRGLADTLVKQWEADHGKE